MVKYSIKIMLCVALAAILGLLPTPLCAQSKSKSGKDSSQTISPEEKARIEEERAQNAKMMEELLALKAQLQQTAQEGGNSNADS